jgi:hypothetical protein
MRSRPLLETRVLLAIGLAAQAGCYWPVASCDEQDDTRLDLQLASGRIELRPGGGIRLDGHELASCSELCAMQPGVVRVVSCNAPAQAEATSSWSVTCHVDVEACHLPTIIDPPSFGGGRRPEGLARSATRPLSAGAWLVELARLEAASVPAFDRLARELAHHQAPAELVRGALCAKQDEIRHARIASRLARREGAEPAPPEAFELDVRSLVDVAVENAVEGCIAETTAAALAAFQARNARDVEVRRAMAGIHRDEARHAVLAWDVLAWTLARLSSSERARVLAALRDAAAGIAAESIAGATPEIRDALGLPSVDQAAAIVRVAREHLLEVAEALYSESDKRRISPSA